jgi:hypothetical protein
MRRGNGVGEATPELVAEADPPGCAGGNLLAGDEAVLEPAQDGGWGDAEMPCRLADIEQRRLDGGFACSLASSCGWWRRSERWGGMANGVTFGARQVKE